MSRVIKGSTVYVSQPKVIQLDELRELQEKYERSNVRSPRSRKLKTDELEQMKEESEAILRETEDMIIELLEKAKEEAESIIAEGNEEAGSIVAEAKEEAEQIRQEHIKRGYEEGIRKAEQEIDETRKTALQESQQIVTAAGRTKMQILRTAESDMMRLVMAIARKVIAGEIETNPEVVINVISEALTYLDKTENISVHINPQEVLQVLDAVNTGQITDKNNKLVDFDVQADKRVSTGGCIIDGEEGQIDASIETRINRIEKSIQGVIGNE